MFIFSSTTLILVFYTRNFIDADPRELSAAYRKYVAVSKLQWWITLTGDSTYNIVHWIFGLKYWTLAFKFKQLKTNQDPDKLNLCFTFTFWVGVFFILLSALLKNIALSDRFSAEVKRKTTIAALVLTAPLYISFLILFDAFRRFRNLKSQEKVINNVKVCALSLAFLHTRSESLLNFYCLLDLTSKMKILARKNGLDCTLANKLPSSLSMSLI